MSFAPKWLTGRATGVVAATAVSAGLAIFNTIAARKAERENTLGASFVDIDGVRLHYLSRGEGPTIVLLHGNGSMIHDWLISGLVDKLARSHRVVVFDRPGFGYSERPRSWMWTPEEQASLLARAFARLQIENPTVVGHSFATQVTLALALNHSASIARIVLIGGYYYPTARVDAVLASAPAIPVIGDAMRYTVSPIEARLLEPAANRKLFAPAPVPGEWAEHFPTGMAVRPSQIRATAAEAALMVRAAAEMSERYEQLKLPVTIIAGAGDEIVDPEQSERLNSEVPGSKFVLVPGAGHMVHHTAAEQVRTAIVEDRVVG